MDFPRSRYWVVGRRVALILIALILGYRSYGDSVQSWFRDPDPSNEIVITQSEFQPAPDGERPLWFVSLRNRSRATTYDRILVEATYMDELGETTEIDQIVIDQRLGPGETHDVGSRDALPRDGAATGALRVVDARIVE